MHLPCKQVDAGELPAELHQFHKVELEQNLSYLIGRLNDQSDSDHLKELDIEGSRIGEKARSAFGGRLAASWLI